MAVARFSGDQLISAAANLRGGMSRWKGDVTFTINTETAPPTIDGVWRYSAQGPLRQNWDLTWVGAEVPADVAAKFADDSAFVTRPLP